MANIAIFRINYKSDFILTLQSDAGWMTPFCIKFWTGAPSQAYFAGYDGTTYTHCAPVAGDSTKLMVQFDDHHLPIGDLKFQIGYHFTVADFPTSIEDEVINQAAVIIDNDGEQQQVMLDFNGETAPEIEFSLPAYANEAQRIANESQRIANEEQRIATETQRIANEEQRISQEQTRQQNEVQRIVQEQARVTAERERFNDYAKLKADAIAATDAANSAADLANEKAQLAADNAQLAADKAALAQSASALATEKAQLATDKAALAQSAATLANEKAALAQQKAEYATAQGDYAKAQGDYAKAQAGVIPTDVTRTQTDATFVNGNHDPLFYLRQASSSLAGLMTAAGYTKLNDMPAAQEVNAGLAYDVSVLHPTSGVNGGSTYASLSAALAVIPQDKRKGGMTVKFVLSSDNKYVQYMYKKTDAATAATFTNVASWQRVDETPTVSAKQYITDGARKPLLAEMMADFAWCSMRTPNQFTNKNVRLTVSGTQGSTEVTASAISPDTLNISDVGSNWVGGVLSSDGINYSVCNFRLKSGNTIEVYPALSETITNGTLSTLMYDSSSTYVGMHLTEDGYKAFMQNLYAKNPKHCEVGRYVARFRSDVDTTCPFTWYGGQINGAQYRFTTLNLYNYWLNRPSYRAYCYQFSTSWTPHTTKSGAYWEVDLCGKSGYLEAFVFPIAQGVLTLPNDQSVHVEVTIDGVLAYSSILTDTICKRICVDYKNASTGKIEIYSNKWAAVEGQAYGFGLGRVTWWVNDIEFPDMKLFPKGSVIAQEFDSWGVFHNGASGNELERLHNEATGVTVPFTNHSLGSQTSAWGMAWFYENVWKYNPSICIQDFGINDTNSIPSSLPETIEGPDGKTYNNRLTAEQYCENMRLIGKQAVFNGIQPVFMRNTLHGSTSYYVFSNSLVDSLSEQIED